MTTDAPMPFASLPPVVRLVNAFADPYDNAVATARTCYSSTIVSPEDVRKDAHARAQRDAIAKSTYAAGHHTTLQHAHFQFALENVSRQLLWSFLHAHPFYNSEQVSQRYVTVRPERVLVPRLPAPALLRYRSTVELQMRAYEELTGLLSAPAAAAFFAVFPARRKRPEDHKAAIKKRAQEVARYVLPVATFAHLYHTVSGLTLHRYHRLCQSHDVPTETRVVVELMVDAVRRSDPNFFASIEDPLPLDQTPEQRALAQVGKLRPSASARAFCQAFDRALGGKRSVLVDYKLNTEATLARAVREVLGLCPSELGDGAAIELVVSPAKNPAGVGPLNLTTLGKLSRTLFHPHYTFQKKLSHSADSQDQRHRMTPGSRPVLQAQYVGGAPDVVVPGLIAATPAALDCFMTTMAAVWRAMDDLLADQVATESALYLLPNAFPIRFEESGDLAALQHKWTTRLCYNAQEEIWQATRDEVEQVRAVHPQVGKYLGAPCAVRAAAGRTPPCPEGSRYCGVRVWTLRLEDYARRA
ncbi:MAG: FAD-dependent thymidylate synthase [Deltaproteobacteria bacterium]|nr:FAD-dependent thymidylate synthase [Deltaproteobacteria bacterium]